MSSKLKNRLKCSFYGRKSIIFTRENVRALEKLSRWLGGNKVRR